MSRDHGQIFAGSLRRVGADTPYCSMRRKLLLALGASALAAPLATFAQPAGRMFRLGWLNAGGMRSAPYQVAFEERLRELGFVEGRNLIIEYRTAENRIERLPALSEELARLNCDVFFAPGSEITLAALKQGSRDTPIVAAAVDYDLGATGHIDSLAHPGGRTTGVSALQSVLPAKRLELLKELLPKARKIAVLTDASAASQLQVAQAGAKQLGVSLQILELKRTPYDYESTIAEAEHARADALLVLGSATFVTARELIPKLALKHRLPSMFHHSLWADAGGLLSYGPNFIDIFRLAAEQVAKILKGAKAGDLPVQQPTRFELVINMKTAKALGVKIPNSILVRADRVIE